MKAAELMIGDWVHVDGVQVDDVNGKPVYELLTRRVKALEKGTITLEDGYDMPAFGCMPIPLTEKILADNKCEVYDKCTFCHGLHKYSVGSDRFIVVFDVHSQRKPHVFCENSVCRLDREVEYVHELQHALRLCGVDKEIIL